MLRAEGALCGDDVAIAEASIRVGLRHADQTGEHRCGSELHRLRAECLRRHGRTGEAATALQAALAIAAEQGARLAELRAAIDHVGLQRTAPDAAAARDRLAAIVATFDPAEPLPELGEAAYILRSDSSAA